MLIPLKDCAELAPAEVGRKAWVLAWAAMRGLPTPGGVVLPAISFWAALDACGSGEQARYLAANALRLDPRHSLDLAARIHVALAHPDVLRLARDHAADAWAGLAARPLVARSSSAQEDGRAATFAGIFVSRLDLASPDELAEAIVACWRSAFAPVALKYVLRMRAAQLDLSLAVLIQPQVRADWYGLYVSADPVSGAPMPIAELTRQGPDALVNGAIAAVHATLRDGAWASVPEEATLLPSLHRLHGMAGRLSELVPGALDIEFAVVAAGAEPVLLQCRPVTPSRAPMTSMPGAIANAVVIGRPCAPGSVAGLALPPDATSPDDVPRIGIVGRLNTESYELVLRHAGLIATDDLSPLSHVAILCRELGVPLVSGVGEHARRLQGSWIALDGASGAAGQLSDKWLDNVHSRSLESALYISDVERSLMLLIGNGASPGAAATMERQWARALGASQARILATPLAPAEIRQLRALEYPPGGGSEPG